MAKNKKEAVENVEPVETAAKVEAVENDKVLIKRVAKGKYNGYDGKDPVVNALTVNSGETVAVSVDKADQLITDFPNDWELA
jgi:hypothetical protein